MIGKPEVIVVEERDVAAAREPDPCVRRAGLIAAARFELNVPDARIANRRDDLARVVGAAAAYDEKLPVVRVCAITERITSPTMLLRSNVATITVTAGADG